MAITESAAFAGESLFADIEHYCTHDCHRTGTPGNRATADWLASGLAALGYTVSRAAFTAPCFALGQTHVRLEDRIVSGIPLWPPRGAVIEGIPGRSIALARLPFHPGGAYREDLHGPALRAAFAPGIDAVVALTEGPTGEAIALNMPADQPDWPVPVLLLGGDAAAPLEAAAARGDTVCLRIEAEPDPEARPENVIGRRGSGPAVIVTTPCSGWFRCGGERGPGVALWRALAAWAAARQDGFEWIFAANSGHELENAGAAALHRLLPPPEGTRLWLHLGAGIATRLWSDDRPARALHGPDPKRFMVASSRVLPVLTEAFAGQPGLATPHPAETAPSAGELTAILARGYDPAIGIFAGHRYHHTASDDAGKTAPELLEPVARSLATALETILGDK